MPKQKKSFEQQYNKPGNEYVVLDAQRAVPHPDDPELPLFLPCKIQLVIMPNGKVAARRIKPQRQAYKAQ